MPRIAHQTEYQHLLGSIDGALFLTQLVYWQKTMKGGWFYKTGKSWKHELGFSRHRRETISNQLTSLGILHTKKGGMHRRTYYYVDLLQLIACIKAIADKIMAYKTNNVSMEVLDEAGNVCQAPLNTLESETNEKTPSDVEQLIEYLTDIHVDTVPLASEEKQNDGHSAAKHLAGEWHSTMPESSQEGKKSAQYLAREQHGTAPESSQVPGQPVAQYLASGQPRHINKINTKITHKTTTKTTHHNTSVELHKNLTDDVSGQNATNAQLSATKLPKNQNPTSGNSSPATRRGGDETESSNKKSQAAQADDVVHQEAKHAVGAHHLQCMKENLANAKKAEGCVADIFMHWQTTLKHPLAKLDEKRKRLIKNALKMGYTTEQLKQAITGCSKTPHNLGDNDRGQRYDGLHIILRDADQIDRFMANAINPPRKMNAQEQLELDNKRIADEYLRSQGLTPVGEENIINHGDL